MKLQEGTYCEKEITFNNGNVDYANNIMRK